MYSTKQIKKYLRKGQYVYAFIHGEWIRIVDYRIKANVPECQSLATGKWYRAFEIEVR